MSHHLSQGTLPGLGELRRRGVLGPLGGASRGASIADWTTLATGKQPEEHRVWRGLEGWAGGLRPTSRASWAVPAVWERLHAAGVNTGSVSWPAARPGAEWPGVHLDDSILEASSLKVEHWALPPCVAPAAVRDAVRHCRVHPTDISREMLLGFVPALDQIDQSRDATLPVLALALAQAATAQSLGLWMLENGGPDAIFLHQPWLERVRAAFESLGGALYANVVPAAWRFLDGLVRTLIAAAPRDAQILVVSPGYGRRPGVVLAAGSRGAAESPFHGADILDLAPTVLGVFGLKCEDLSGRSLGVLGASAPLRLAGRTSPRAPLEPDRALLAQAANWGFTAPPQPPATWRAQGWAELAGLTVWRDPTAAERLSRQALDLDATNILALRVRATALALCDRPDELPDLAARLRLAAPGRGWGDLAEGAYHVLRREMSLATSLLTRAENDSDPDTLYTVAIVWMAARRPSASQRVLRRLALIDPEPSRAKVSLAALAMDRRDFLGAESLLAEAMKADPANPAIYLQWSRLCTLTARPDQAKTMRNLAWRFGAALDPWDGAPQPLAP
jgi:hypothetical protein